MFRYRVSIPRMVSNDLAYFGSFVTKTWPKSTRPRRGWLFRSWYFLGEKRSSSADFGCQWMSMDVLSCSPEVPEIKSLVYDLHAALKGDTWMWAGAKLHTSFLFFSQ